MKLPRAAVAGLLTIVAATGCATGPAPGRATPPVVDPASDTRDVVDVASLREASRRLAGVRPAFRACIDTAGGDATAMQACIQSEMQYQQSRLDGALAARRGRSSSNGNLDEIQAQWASERDRLCGSDAPGVPMTKRLEAGICRLDITAARADVLAR